MGFVGVVERIDRTSAIYEANIETVDEYELGIRSVLGYFQEKGINMATNIPTNIQKQEVKKLLKSNHG